MTKLFVWITLIVLAFSYVPQFADPAWAITYYVDSSVGSNSNTCAQAQTPNTPKQTVSGIMACRPGPGQTVKFRGEFRETIQPNQSGEVLYSVQNISNVADSVVTFNTTIANVYPNADYVTIYGSRNGNSGAFRVLNVNGNRVTVDTSDLPLGHFLSETYNDPGDLQAAILRPVHFTAWDKSNPPVFNTRYQVYHAINRSVIMVSYLKSIGGNSVNPGYYVWPAFEIDGNNSGNSDFQIFDHLEVVNAECAVAIEAHEFQSNYDIIQHNYFHGVGASGNASDEIVYFGFAYRYDLHHDYVQIMYNRIGPHVAGTGDGIEIKPSAHKATVFGNEIVGVYPHYCDDSPIKIDGTAAFVANNYLHDISHATYRSCGISIIDSDPTNSVWGGEGTIVANNVVTNVRGVGIRVLDADNVQVLNNTIYNIPKEVNCNADCIAEESMGIEIQNWQGSTENLLIKNNIVQKVHIGIGRYIWSHNEFPVSIDSDYNTVFDAIYPFRGTIRQSANDQITDPKMTNPSNGNFELTALSPARGSGIGLNAIFTVDKNLRQRVSIWDRGALMFSGVLPIPTVTATPTRTIMPTFTQTVIPTFTRAPRPTSTPTPECLRVVFSDNTTIIVCKP